MYGNLMLEVTFVVTALLAAIYLHNLRLSVGINRHTIFVSFYRATTMQ